MRSTPRADSTLAFRMKGIDADVKKKRESKFGFELVWVHQKCVYLKVANRRMIVDLMNRREEKQR